LHQQADTLWSRDYWEMRSNGGIIGAAALFQVSLMFPEFLASDMWKHAAEDSLLWALDNTFYEDGSYYEESLHYHRLAHNAFMVALSLASVHDYSLPEEFLAGMESESEALMHLVKPDLYLPQIGDGDNLWSGQTFLDAWEVFPHRSDFLYVGTMGLSGAPPQYGCRTFPFGRYYVMRSDWEYRTVWVGPKPEQVSDARYLLLTADREVPGSHYHFDPLSIEVHAYQQTLVKDPGQFGYDEPSWRDYFQATLQHNTIAIDDRDAWHYPDSTDKQWFVGRGFGSLVAQHFNYYWLGVVHTRGVVFVRPSYWVVSDVLTLFPGPMPMPHDFYQSWHFMPGVVPSVEPQSGTAIAGQLVIAPSRGPEMDTLVEDSYVCLSGGVLEDAKALRYRQYGVAPLAFHTVLVPFAYPLNPPSLTVEHVPAEEEGTELPPWKAAGLRVALEDGVALYAANHDSSDAGRSFLSIISDGLAACVLRGSSGQIERLFLQRGRHLMTGDTVLVEMDEATSVEWADSVVIIQGLSNPTVPFRIWAPGALRVREGGRWIPFHREGPYVTGIGSPQFTPDAGGPALRLLVPSPSLGGIDLGLVPRDTDLRVHDLLGRLHFSGTSSRRWLPAAPGVYVVSAPGDLQVKVLVVH
jgi:hypothetical protein